MCDNQGFANVYKMMRAGHFPRFKQKNLHAVLTTSQKFRQDFELLAQSKWEKLNKLSKEWFFLFPIMHIYKYTGIYCDALRDLVPFVKFNKLEKHPWRSVTFSKVGK